MMVNALLALGTLLLIEVGIFVLVALLLMPRRKVLASFFLILSIIIGGAQAAVWAHDALGMQADAYYTRIAAYLDASQPDLGAEAYSLFRIVALSNMAEGLVRYGKKHTDKRNEIAGYLERIVEISMKEPICPYPSMRMRTKFSEYGFYLAHFNIIVNMYERHTGDTTYGKLHRNISTYLARRSLASKTKHVRSYPSLPFLWPADQAVVLYSLCLHDSLHGDSLSRAPITAWLDYMKHHGTHEETELHVSEISGRAPHASEPRGCALSWTLRYMAWFAPEQAHTLWINYTRTFKRQYLVIAGFREYEPGLYRDPDIDSGPIVYNIGMAATGFAFGAAKANKDLYTYYQLINALYGTRILGRIGVGNDLQPAMEVLDYPLTVAVLFNAIVQ